MDQCLEFDGLTIAGVGSAVVHPFFARQTGHTGDLPAALLRGNGDSPSVHLHLPIRLAPYPLGRIKAGDVVVFKVTCPGAFSEIECSTGKRVPIALGGVYIGVLGDSSSLSHFTSDLSLLSRCGADGAHMISVAGMVSVATSQSRDLNEVSGFSHPPKVTLLGSVLDAVSGAPLNTISAALESRLSPLGDGGSAHPIVLLVGTTTNVGKTTLAGELITAFAAQRPCAAIKATGTGSLNDSTQHRRAGAYFATSFMEEGFPSTYFLESADVVALFQRMLLSVPPPPSPFRDPRAGAIGPVIVAECGGDLIWAGNPALFGCGDVMQAVRAIIVCADNAVAALGAVTMLRALAVPDWHYPVYLNLPLVNPRAFMQRVDAYRHHVPVAGVVAAAAALEFSPGDLLTEGSRARTAVLSVAELTQIIAGIEPAIPNI